jgi:hypothetical protein
MAATQDPHRGRIRFEGSFMRRGVNPEREPGDDAAAGPPQLGGKLVSKPPPVWCSGSGPNDRDAREPQTLQAAGAPQTTRDSLEDSAGACGFDPFAAFEGRLLHIALHHARVRIGKERGECGAPNGIGGPTEVAQLAAEAYCVKCKAKRDIKDAVQITMKNGRPATEGKCPVCGTKMFKIGSAG